MNFKIEILEEENKSILMNLVKIHISAFEKFNFRYWNYSDFSDFLNSSYRIFYYESHNKILGFAVVNFNSDFNEIITIAVDNIYQRKKIGKILLEYIINYFNSKKDLYLEVAKNNCQAINFYKKNGFKIIAERKKYYFICRGKNKGTRVDALVMKLTNNEIIFQQ